MTETNQLLREYTNSRSEQAFGELVTRYLDLVYSVAIRRMGGNEDLARDVVQTVFSDLARKASSLRAESSLGGWLHRHTCFVSATLLRAERRRLAREQIAVEMNHLNQPSEAVWQQLAPALDEAIDQLGEADRQAIVLRYYEHRDLRSVGAALGTNEDAAQKRLSRALEKLRTGLSAKGVSLSATALGSLLTARAVSAAPAGWAQAISASAGAAIAQAGFMASLIALMTSLKIGLTIGVATVVVAAGALLYHRAPATNTQTPSTPAGRALVAQVEPTAGTEIAAPSAAENSTSPPAAPLKDKLRITVISADTSEPISGVQFSYRGWEGERFSGKQFISNRSGLCDIALPRASITLLELTSMIDGYADTRLEWRTDRGEAIPETYTLRLTRPVLISGRVVDAEGAAVAGAKMGWNHETDPATETRPQSHYFSWIKVETDSDGRWQINRIAPDMLRLLYGAPRHPDHISPPLLMVSEDRGAEQQLRAGTHVFRMGKALSVSGTVVDPDGKPVADASVFLGGFGEAGRPEIRSLPDGAFVMPGCKPGRNLITAEATGYTAGTLAVEVSDSTPPVRLILQHGRTLRLKVVDKAGQPVAGANVWFDTMRNEKPNPQSPTPPPVQVEFNPKTDQDGRAVWDAAPAGDLYFSFHKEGFMRLGDVKVQADGQEHVITLPPALVVFGSVTDANSHQPIPKFRIACGWPSPDLNGQIQPRFSNIDRFWLNFSGGEYKHSFEEPLIGGMPTNPGYMLKFEAEGYAPFLSRVLKDDELEVRLDVTLQPATELAVTVFLPDGKPAMGVEVALLPGSNELALGPGGFVRSFSRQTTGGLVQTDSNGVFKLAPDDAVQTVVAAGSAGFAQATPAALRQSPALRLQAWGRIEGAFAAGSKAAGRALSLSALIPDPNSIRMDNQSFLVRSDAQGRFALPQVPPGRWMLVREISSQGAAPSPSLFMPLQAVEVRSGQTTTLELGATARPVSSRMRFPAEFQRNSDMRVFAYVHTPLPTPSVELQKDPEALRRWAQSPEIVARRTEIRSYPLTEGADGTWFADEVPAGEYILSVHVAANAQAMHKPIANADLPVTVPSGPIAEPVDLGEILVHVAR